MVMEAPRRVPATSGGEDPSQAASNASSTSTEDSQWLANLSEPELDFLISLKMLAVKRAETTGRPHLADAFDLRTLRALGIVLLESFKERLKETSVDPAILDNLVLLRDSDVNVSASGSDSEMFRSRKYQPTANSKKKRESRCMMGDMKRLSGVITKEK